MKEFFEIVLDSVIDSAKILPILLLVYFLIEFFEHKQALKFENMKFLNKKYSPLFGSLFGSLPQCGFSIVATDLFNKKKVTVGALIAVYVATSDEALPIMLSQPSSYKWILPLLFAKIIIAVAVGYISQFLFDAIFIRKQKSMSKNKNINSLHLNEKDSKQLVKQLNQSSSSNLETAEHSSNINNNEQNDLYKSKNITDDSSLKNEQNFIEDISNLDQEKHIYGDDEKSEHHAHEDHDIQEQVETHHGCCHHNIEHSKYDWKHPLFHSLKVIAMIFIINIIFGCIISFGFKGEENLAEFLTRNTAYALQPLLAMIIGFIPNCASSVVLTQLYLIGGLSFGSLIAGLVVNAGLGLILLLKQNKRPKENIFIIITLVVTSLSFGYLLHYII